MQKVTLEEELEKEFPNKTIKITDSADKKEWIITIDGISSNVPAGTESNQTQIDPAVEYGYKNNTGVVEANTLIPGDIINYYYKAEEPISCVVMYNDESHGLQVISEDIVRDVILGCNTDGTIIDPKAIQTFEFENPTGYDNTNLEKARWSYNHAIEILNGYAQDYLGLMSENARCVGASANNVVLNEDETSNMFTNTSYTDFNNYDGKLKNIDKNISGTYYVSYYGQVSEDLKTLDTLGIVKTPTSKDYWLASRNINSSQNQATFYVNGIDGGGQLIKGRFSLWSKRSTNSPNCNGYSAGLRPIITLKSNIQIEKTRHQDFGSGAFWMYMD